MDLRAPLLASIITVVLVIPPTLWGSLEGREIFLVAIYAFVAALVAGMIFRPRSSTR